MALLGERNRERVLEAIDQLRHRKARPDFQRICNYLFRKFAINSSEAKTHLQWCVDNNFVRRVEYKGSISYRNAMKKALKGQATTPSPSTDDLSYHHLLADKFKRKFGHTLTNALGELILQEPDYLELGVPPLELIAHIQAKQAVRYTKKFINVLLDKEVSCGNVIRMENGNYSIRPSAEDKDSTTSEWNSDNSMSSAAANGDYGGPTNFTTTLPLPSLQTQKKQRSISKMPQTPPLGVVGPPANTNIPPQSEQEPPGGGNNSLRVGGRRKRAKKVFDPSDTHIPRKRGRPAGSLNKTTIEKHSNSKVDDDYRPESIKPEPPSKVCSICHQQRYRGPQDRLISCKECTSRAHYCCLNRNEDFTLKMYPDNTWQCPTCKTCTVCSETADSGSLTVCCVCADGYHSTCHQPRITERIKPNQRWFCINCQVDAPKQENGNSYKTSSNDSSVSNSVSSRSNSPILSNTPPHLSPQTSFTTREQESPVSEIEDKEFEDNIDPAIPDASNWTHDQVYEYFAQFFPNEAKIFKEQEIDGRSLLLMRRIDVISNLKLKLGPALRIYKHVVRLQVRRDDPKLYWL